MEIRDASFVELSNGQYLYFIADCTLAINTVYHLNISIFTDASGINYALDSSGNPIQNRLIMNMNYSYPYVDSDTQQFVYGYMALTFNDGSSFSNTDAYETSYWYSLQGMEQLGIKQFS